MSALVIKALDIGDDHHPAVDRRQAEDVLGIEAAENRRRTNLRQVRRNRHRDTLSTTVPITPPGDIQDDDHGKWRVFDLAEIELKRRSTIARSCRAG